MADPSFPSRRSSNASRRTLQRRSSRLSQNDSLIDLFPDEDETDYMPVADGFRPASAANAGPLPGDSSPSRPSTPQLPPRAASPPRATEYLKKRIAGQERSSAMHRSSLSGSQRDSMIHRASVVSTGPETTSRPLSTISGLSVPASESPYTVPSGPSTSFAAYPQVSGLNRHASTSTVQTQNRPYNGPNRPTHPYALYPQIPANPEPDPFSDPADIANVGFPGIPANYARVGGQGGEDADDLIGPDGHTEQLPPYSLFPEQMHPKERNELERATTPLLSAGDRSSGVGPSSANTAAESLAEPSSASTLLEHDDDDVQINVAAARVAGYEEPNRTQRWKEKSKKRTCWGRVPVWAWIVLVVVLCLLAAGLGSAIGVYFAKTRPPPPPPDNDASASYPTPTGKDEGQVPPTATVWATVTTTLIDAAPLSTTPSNLPTVVPGSYAVRFDSSTPPVSNDKCVDPPMNGTWGCSRSAYLNLTISYSDATLWVNLQPEYRKDMPLQYGAQAPSLRGPAQLSLMQDIQEQTTGPAMFFQQLVDKVLIVQHSDIMDVLAKQKKIDFPNRNKKEGFRSWRPSSNNQDDDQDDDLDDAIDEIDSYLQEREPLPLEAYHDLEARGSKEPLPVLTGDFLWYCFWNSTILEGFIYVMQPNANHDQEQQAAASAAANSMEFAHSFTAAAASTYTHGVRRGDSQGATTTTAPVATPSILPFNLKLEERRATQSLTTPYCQKMFANPDGQIVKPSGVAGWFNIAEKQPVLVATSGAAGSSKRSSNNTPDSACKCIWKL